MIGSILLFLVVLSVLVLAHEAGHFFTALKLGATVEEFGIGFPPRAWSITRKGIRYSLNWIPLGGFVKIKGESGDDRQDPTSFASKPAWKRLIILSAGVFMNFVLAIVLLSIGFGLGMPQVVDGSLPTNATVRDQSINIVEVAKGSAAEIAGIKAGDLLTTIDGQTFSSDNAAHDYISAHTESAMTLVVKRDDAFYTYSATPTVLAEANNQKALGVGLLETATVSYPWYLAPVEGVKATVEFTGEIITAFYDLVKNLIVHQQVSADLSGPVGIAVMTGQVAKLGAVYLIQFAAVLSINLGVINFIPFPALDGGRILFVLIEKFRGKPVSAKLEGMMHNIGFLLLMSLVVLITYRDLVKFGGQLLGSK